MAVVRCAHCGDEFEARRSTAKWCSDRCRKAARRKSPATSSTVDRAGDGADHEPTAETEYGRDVLAAVKRDLEKAGQLDSVEGRVAMYLARKSIDPDCKSPAAMFREMRAALATAVAAGEPDPAPAPVGDVPDPADDDEVSRARKARQEARKAAGLS